MTMNTHGNPSLRQRTKNALERIDDLEKQFMKLVDGLNNAFEQLNRKVGNLEDSLEAVVTILGVETVAQSITEIRLKRAEEAATLAKEQVKALFEAGVYVKSDTVTNKSILVGHEVHPETGEIAPPGFIKASFEEIKPELKEKFLGQKLGFKTDTGSGNLFELLEIYEEVEGKTLPSPEAVTPEAPAPKVEPGEGTATTVTPLV
jgi:hypothetical protein